MSKRKDTREWKRAIPHGTCISHYRNGIVSSVQTYDHDVPSGSFRGWDANGLPTHDCFYLNGKFEGERFYLMYGN
ncbi:MAG: hypothetical protein HC836_39455 [Richelia sp. RM2_1_2]|nr:hypothetical protein [Richelia sp. RM2_1_2]